MLGGCLFLWLTIDSGRVAGELTVMTKKKKLWKRMSCSGTSTSPTLSAEKNMTCACTFHVQALADAFAPSLRLMRCVLTDTNLLIRYMLCLNYNPMTLYIYRRGFARFSSTHYQVSRSDKGPLRCHGVHLSTTFSVSCDCVWISGIDSKKH